MTQLDLYVINGEYRNMDFIREVASIIPLAFPTIESIPFFKYNPMFIVLGIYRRCEK